MSLFNRLARIVLVVIIAIASSSRADDATAIDMLRQYFDYLITGNHESAQLMWTASAQERAGRFGITYDSIICRPDASSPVIQNFQIMQYHLERPVRQLDAMPGDTLQCLRFSTLVGSETVKHNYFAMRDNRWFWLCYPQDYYARTWPIVESKYLRIHVHPLVKEYLSPVVLAEVDRFVVAMADTLKLPKSALAEIAAKKVEWFYCASDSTVEDITGHRTKGMLDLGSNDIISATFPHYHELVHLLVNIRLKTLPIHTLALLREGLAVRYGGRWGKSNSALADLGAYLYREKLVELDSIIVDRGYDGVGEADIVYPVAGVFASFLLDHSGLESYLKGYRSLSGSGPYLLSLKPAQIKAALTQITGYPTWEALVAGFDEYLAKASGSYVVAAPGRVDNGKVITQGNGYSVTQSKEWLGFEFTVADSLSAHGTLLFGPMTDAAGHVSSLFVEHYKGSEKYEGYRYAVRFDQNEAGLYDYVTNQLLAKYIWGITPSDDYYARDKGLISIKFKKALVGKALPGEGQTKLLPM